MGISGGLAGVARFAGGSLAQAIYTTILTNTQTSRAAQTVPAAAEQAGLGANEAQQLLQALASGATDTISKIPGIVSCHVDVSLTKANIG